ncbi:uncharacterized protein I303_104678 [Kwoniella dejecticola CBS 10117]|uniref:Uncharacterized protein n=1 Tax=Kwoniella dejecticola CBS 10117 TaxID=1296121 RepID=A0A1A6A4M9_9TREE|nr:uncharacterized protein I303_04341 [Kwoniella dejecticola CBS 10117]OBR85014.1 hypothetical protein I303_04341 [Kwoniella dejecticola CBS 10117]
MSSASQQRSPRFVPLGEFIDTFSLAGSDAGEPRTEQQKTFLAQYGDRLLGSKTVSDIADSHHLGPGASLTIHYDGIPQNQSEDRSAGTRRELEMFGPAASAAFSNGDSKTNLTLSVFQSLDGTEIPNISIEDLRALLKCCTGPMKKYPPFKDDWQQARGDLVSAHKAQSQEGNNGFLLSLTAHSLKEPPPLSEYIPDPAYSEWNAALDRYRHADLSLRVLGTLEDHLEVVNVPTEHRSTITRGVNQLIEECEHPCTPGHKHFLDTIHLDPRFEAFLTDQCLWSAAHGSQPSVNQSHGLMSDSLFAEYSRARSGSHALAIPRETVHRPSEYFIMGDPLIQPVLQAARSEGSSQGPARDHQSELGVFRREMAEIDAGRGSEVLERSRSRTGHQQTMAQTLEGTDPVRFAMLRLGGMDPSMKTAPRGVMRSRLPPRAQQSFDDRSEDDLAGIYRRMAQFT